MKNTIVNNPTLKKAKQETTTKKEVIAFTVADEQLYPYAKQLERSIRHFHTEKELPFKIITGQTLQAYHGLDNKFHLRSTPFIAEQLLKDYDLVIRIDPMTIVTGDLNYVIQTKDYDIATVMNYQRGLTGLTQGWGITPVEYFSSTFVALRSEKAAHHWNAINSTQQFDRLMYAEQDSLNITAYYGNFNLRCLDHGDGVAEHYSMYGLVSRPVWPYLYIEDNKIVVDKHLDGNFPPRKFEVRVLNFRDQLGQAINYKTRLSKDVIKYLEKIVK